MNKQKEKKILPPKPPNARLTEIQEGFSLKIKLKDSK